MYFVSTAVNYCVEILEVFTHCASPLSQSSHTSQLIVSLQWYPQDNSEMEILKYPGRRIIKRMSRFLILNIMTSVAKREAEKGYGH